MKIYNYIKQYPVTTCILIVNTIYLLLILKAGGFTTENLDYYGSLYRQAVEDGEYYRLVTSMFLHGNIIHFAVNMAALIGFAVHLEELLDKRTYVILYMLSGILANVASLWLVDVPSVGASGALFGCLGFFLYMSLFKKHWMDLESRKAVFQITIFNIIISFVIPFINEIAHLGGLFAGVVISFFILRGEE